MQYLLLIHDDESEWAAMSEALRAKYMQEYADVRDALKKSGNFVGSQQLHPTSRTTTVRVRDGKTLATDGPFAETREQLGGFFVIEARDLDEAIAIAARIPSARSGTIEVRPVLRVG
ncbi:MAG TPA: YciI family protein [Candidatus Acidoferrum sp.]|nr:YciI family protein [Candidatus Acidoferrum sp.]